MSDAAQEKRFSPERLRQAREAEGLTLRALGDAVGVVEKTLWSWEAGRTQPDATQLAKLSQALNQSITHFYE